MSLQDRVGSSHSTDLSAGRKRDSQQEDAAESPRSERAKRNKESGSVAINVNSGHGCSITGAIEGSFDAGYFLNVRSVDTGTHLRGIVFIPGRFTPITAANDLAPSVMMYQREQMLIPSSVSISQIKASVGDQSSMGKSAEKGIEAKETTSVLTDQDKVIESVTEVTNEPVGSVDDQSSTSPSQSKNVESDSQAGLKESVASEDEAITLPSKESIDMDPELEHQQTFNNVTSEQKEADATIEKETSRRYAIGDKYQNYD